MRTHASTRDANPAASIASVRAPIASSFGDHLRRDSGIGGRFPVVPVFDLFRDSEPVV